jgi:HD-GYP domain-containing protein (c-di-GMP phosphodiesterase class II)
MEHEEAIAELARGAGSQFDPKVVGALVSYLERGPGERRFTTAR